jgi:hypothetical protein
MRWRRNGQIGLRSAATEHWLTRACIVHAHAAASNRIHALDMMRIAAVGTGMTSPWYILSPKLVLHYVADDVALKALAATTGVPFKEFQRLAQSLVNRGPVHLADVEFCLLCALLSPCAC